VKKLLSILTLLTLPILFNQTSSAQQNQDDVVRITTNLVQVDAVVVDKDGNPVTNLTANDFEILQDGKPQKLTSVSFVNVETQGQTQAAAKNSGKADKNAPLAPPIRTNAANAGRLITFIVDDGTCFASISGMAAARGGLEKFVREQMQPDDLVAIFQTRAGSSMLQQFTSDKNKLLSVARKIRWLPPTRTCGNAATGNIFDPARTNSNFNRDGIGQSSFETENDRVRREKIEDDLKSRDIVGTIGVLRYVIRGLDKISGRKTVFFLSDGIGILTKSGNVGVDVNNPGSTTRASDALTSLRDLIEQANRAAVVFNTIDVRGVVNPSYISAEDDFEGFRGNINATSGVRNDREAAFRNSQDGLSLLANETGGRFYQGNNFLDVPIRRALNSERGYYLLAYEPDSETFKGKKFHEIEVKVKGSGLQARSRSGFSAVTDETVSRNAPRPKPKSAESELYEAIAAPLPRAGLDLRLSAFYGNAQQAGDFVRALVYVDGKQITFTDEPNGMKKAVFDVVAITFNEKNEPVDEFNKTHTIRFPAASLAAIQQNGIIYTADIPVKKAGIYNFRIAMRDAASRQLGSAAQQIEVPELKKGELLLTSPIVGEAENNNGKMAAPSLGEAVNGFSPAQSISSPAIRRFRPGSVLGYSYKIYNAGLDKSTQQPKLTMQVRLYRNGQLVTESPAAPAQLEMQADLKRINDYGFMRLPPNALVGDYALQIIVRDMVKNEIGIQSVDFEVVD
jgi:VWFA-related protein